MPLVGLKLFALGISYRCANVQTKVKNAGFFSLIYKTWVSWDFKFMAWETQ